MLLVATSDYDFSLALVNVIGVAESERRRDGRTNGVIDGIRCSTLLAHSCILAGGGAVIAPLAYPPHLNPRYFYANLSALLPSSEASVKLDHRSIPEPFADRTCSNHGEEADIRRDSYQVLLHCFRKGGYLVSIQLVKIPQSCCRLTLIRLDFHDSTRPPHLLP